MVDFMVDLRNSLSVEPDFHGELACEFPGSENCSSFRWRPTHGRVDKRRKGRQKKQHMFFSPENYHDNSKHECELVLENTVFESFDLPKIHFFFYTLLKVDG